MKLKVRVGSLTAHHHPHKFCQDERRESKRSMMEVRQCEPAQVTFDTQRNVDGDVRRSEVRLGDQLLSARRAQLVNRTLGPSAAAEVD